jgi:hypothetical protein
MIDPKLAELQAAREILAEVLQVRVRDVDEMIHSRMVIEKERTLFPVVVFGEQPSGWGSSYGPELREHEDGS